jgi:hypothetical protein
VSAALPLNSGHITGSVASSELFSS